MFARVNGTRIYFDVDGASHVPDTGRLRERPVVFLLHGGPGADHSAFKSQLGWLTELAQLVYIDHRGSGRSASCDIETCTLENNVADVEALREYLGLERVSVLGYSYGGMVALAYAIEHPSRVANLILQCTAASYRFLDDARRIVEERCTPAQKKVCEKLFEGTFENTEELEEFFREMGPMYGRRFNPATFDTGWPKTLWNYEQFNFGFREVLTSFDLTPRLHEIQCPTLVIGAAHDWICPPNHSKMIADAIPSAHLKLFQESSHRVADDEADAFRAAVRGFLTYPAS